MAAGVSDNSDEGYIRSRLRNAITNSNNILSGISTNFSKMSIFSSGSSSTLNIDKPEQHSYSDEEISPLRKFFDANDSYSSPCSGEKKSPVTIKERLKETFKLENLKDLRPTLEDMMKSESSSEPSTLPTNTPESVKNGFMFNLSSINQSLPRKFEDYKARAMRTINGDLSEPAGKPSQSCAIKVEYVDGINHKETEMKNDLDVDNVSTCLSSKSFNSSYSLQACGSDPFDKLKMKPEIISSGSPSDGDGLGHSTSLDSTDSDPNKKLWIRSNSQISIQSWASSLSYDSQAEDLNEIREFMMTFVEDVFKQPHAIDVDRKSEFGKLCQNELGRLWFARCINAKRCCKKVQETSFFSLIQHFSVMLFECSEADDFSPAKSLMNMCFTFYHEVESGGSVRKEYLYSYLRQQPIWKSIRFWNAAFFDALQCERWLRPVVTREEIECNRSQAVQDEMRYQENITFGQLGTFTCNMHAFGLPKELIIEFLRKQVTIASLRADQVKLLRDNVERMFQSKPEWD